jgi:gamma-glutamylcyclotransferase (GGCT)/AIG2-like uncharacterized protein YtfP
VTDRVFVYGTLRRAGRFHAIVAPFVREAVEARVDGILLDLGAYPGWVEGEGTVWGEVLLLRRASEALRRLDAFEECFGPDDPRSMYERVEVEALTPAGSVRAWAYRYRGPAAGRRRVDSGVWGAPEDGGERRAG